MAHRIAQGAALRVPLKAYLASDHVSAATGKTLAVVVSKNCAAFGNPSAGPTNAVEVGSGWYYVDLSGTDTGTLGPLIVRATGTAVDDVEPTPMLVVDAASMGAQNLDATVSSRNATTPPTAAAIRAEIDANSTKLDAAMSTRAAAATALSTADWSGTRAAKLDNLDATVSSRNATTPPTVAAIRAEIDANSTKLDAAVSTRAAAATALSTADWSGTRAAKLDNLDATVSSRNATTPPTAAEVADKFLGRNLAGGSDGGTATVAHALMMSGIVHVEVRAVTETTGFIDVYPPTGGGTPAFSVACTFDGAGKPIVEVGA